MEFRRGQVALIAFSMLALAACGGGGGKGRNSGGNPPPSTVTVTGTVDYVFVPPNNGCNGLNFAGSFVRPIRGATVQLLNAATGDVLVTATSSDSGSYSFVNITPNTMVRLRVRAELKKTSGASRWDVEVRDNYDDSLPEDNRPPLGNRPLYVVEGIDFDTGAPGTKIQDMTATTGWDGASYSGDRSAAPFSILDIIYTGLKFIEAADPDATFPAFDVFWSVNNTSRVRGEIDLGELGSSFYRSGVRQLFLVGDASWDTEEFDDHVVMHEWGHYFEDAFSRSDSVGGRHAIGESLDARLAFGEGWATAFAGIALDDPVYCDTGAAGTNAVFVDLNVESDSFGPRGWYNELNVATFIYDLWDTTADGTDTDSVGWNAIFNTMAGPQQVSQAFTSIFSFAAELRTSVNPAGQALIDSQLDRYNIVMGADLDIWATNEDNDAGGAPDVLPLYTDYTADGSVLNICVNGSFDGLNRDGNNVAEYRYIRVNVANESRYRIEVNTVNPPSLPSPGFDCTADPFDPENHQHSDPDISMIRNGLNVLTPLPGFPGREGLSCEPNQEVATTVLLSPGTYAMDVTEFRLADSDSPAGFPGNPDFQVCFDISMQAIN